MDREAREQVRQAQRREVGAFVGCDPSGERAGHRQ